MDEIAKRFATQAAVPLVIDSTEPEVMEAALVHIGGRAVLNSANLEDGDAPGSRLDRVFSLAREFGSAVICLLIGFPTAWFIATREAPEIMAARVTNLLASDYPVGRLQVVISVDAGAGHPPAAP